MHEQQQVEGPAAQDNQDFPVNAAFNDLVELQLQNPIPIDPMALGANQPDLPKEDAIIEEMANHFPAPHCLGNMNNICPHCAARFFQEECTTQGIFTKCCFQGKVALPPVQIPPGNIAQLFTGDTTHSRHFLEHICHYNAAMAMAS